MELDYRTADEIVTKLHISRKTLTNWITLGLPVHQVVPRGRLLFDEGEVRDWIQSRCTSTAPDHGGGEAVS